MLHSLPTAVPGPVGNLSATARSDDIFYVSWDQPVHPNGALTEYQVWISNLINTTETDHYTIAPNMQELIISSGIRKITVYTCHLYSGEN